MESHSCGAQLIIHTSIHFILYQEGNHILSRKKSTSVSFKNYLYSQKHVNKLSQHQFAVKKKVQEKKENNQAGWIRTWALRLEDPELNQQTIWTVAQLWLLCYDRDILAHNSIMKVKLKILECVSLSFLMLYLLVLNHVRSMFWS